MKESKYRALVDGEFIYGVYVTNNKGIHNIITPLEKEGYKITSVNPNKVSSYTGVRDSDGVEIYEGDIISYVHKSKVKTYTREVVFEGGCYGVYENEDCFMYLYAICSEVDSEASHVGFVIGNIYQTPELLKVGENIL